MLPTFPVRIDPHVHSEGSYDGHDPVELLLEQASEIGLDAIVITDHDSIGESLRAAELAPEYGLIGIPGVEVSTAHGHLLAIGVESLPEPGRPFPETVVEIRDLDGAAIVPHPFQRSRHGVKRRHIVDCDAVEVYNSWLFTGYRNRRAEQFATGRGYPRVAASDAHSVATVGRAYTEILVDPVLERTDLNADIIVRALKDGATETFGRRNPIHRSTRHYAKGAGKKTGYVLKSQLASLL